MHFQLFNFFPEPPSLPPVSPSSSFCKLAPLQYSTVKLELLEFLGEEGSLNLNKC